MNNTVPLAVIGCGLISQFHIESIEMLENTALAGVFDLKAEVADKVAAEHGVRAYHSLQEIWDDTSVSGVCICTPSGTHGELALDALRHGKHVLIEKPMALSCEECDLIIAETEKNGLQAGVVSQLRFSPGIMLVKKAVEQGKIGKIISTELNMKYYRDKSYYTASSWRGTKRMDGGGALMNQGIHGVDLLQYIAGMPKSVFAQCRTLLHNIEVEDTLHAVLMYNNGALGTIIATTSVYPGFTRRLTICGENGTVGLEEDSICTWELKDGTEKPDTAATLICGSSDPSRIGVHGHLRQIGNFAAAIKGEEKLLVDAREGYKPLELIWSIYQASEQNTIVAL